MQRDIEIWCISNKDHSVKSRIIMSVYLFEHFIATGTLKQFGHKTHTTQKSTTCALQGGVQPPLT